MLPPDIIETLADGCIKMIMTGKVPGEMVLILIFVAKILIAIAFAVVISLSDMVYKIKQRLFGIIYLRPGRIVVVEEIEGTFVFYEVLKALPEGGFRGQELESGCEREIAHHEIKHTFTSPGAYIGFVSRVVMIKADGSKAPICERYQYLKKLIKENRAKERRQNEICPKPIDN